MSEAQSEKTPGLSADEQQEVSSNQPPRAAVLHETIRLQGDQELERTLAALWWSALAAGLSMGLSLMAMGLLYSRLPDGESAQVIATGGLAESIIPHCRRDIRLEKDLLFIGLWEIWKRNRRSRT